MEIASLHHSRLGASATRFRWALPVFLAVISFSIVIAALLSEFIGGIAPCKLCYIQRFPHVVTGLAALCAWALSDDDVFYLLFLGVCGTALVFGTLFSVFHTGGELGFWDLSSACEVTVIKDGQSVPADFFLAQAGTDCARSAWRLFGLPMAGFNIIASGGLSLLTAFWITLVTPRLDLTASGA